MTSSANDDVFDIMSVDEETKTVVSSYMRYHQHTLLRNNELLCIIPELIHHITIRYYYRTHSIYEWKVNDPQQLENIKNAVPGQSFNNHFKLHNLDWFLKFYPNGTKQSKQGNVFLLLYLRSTPEISRMSATCKVWLSELDKGREHYKDFNDKNKYTGWRSGLVKTAEIADLSQLTFQVTIQIFEIYDKSEKNVTDKYIGLGIDKQQTILHLRKELEFEKQKVQRLTIERDELNDMLYETESQSQYGLAADDDDDEKYNRKEKELLACVVSDRDICKIKFERWLCDTVRLPQYLDMFKECQCNDVRMIEFLDAECIEKEIGIKQSLHRKLIIKKAKEFGLAQNQFSRVCDENQSLKVYKETLENKGILRINDLRDIMQCKDELNRLFEGNPNHLKIVESIWTQLNSSQIEY